MSEFSLIVILTFLQNASFTLVSRARNSNSITYHLIAALISNFLYLIVINKLIKNLENPLLTFGYLLGSVSGSIIMHYIAMKYFEKKK